MSMTNDLKLIELYRENAILWDSRLDEYKLSGKKSSVWDEIAEALQTTSGTFRRVRRHLSGFSTRTISCGGLTARHTGIVVGHHVGMLAMRLQKFTRSRLIRSNMYRRPREVIPIYCMQN